MRLSGHFEPFENITQRLREADIVVSAVASGRYVLTQAMVKDALAARRQKPIFLIDAGVPVDMEPAVNDLDSAFVYDLADLEGVAVEGKVFMGDTGSLSLGGIIAVIALSIRKELLIPVLCGIFLIENLSVMMFTVATSP